MLDIEDLKNRLNAIITNNIKGAPVSGSLLNILSLRDKDEVSSSATVASSCLQCGNGTRGPISPGERQVNDPAQDSAPGVFPHITQSETSIATYGNYVFFGFNDSNNAISMNTYTGYAFSSDNGVTWLDYGNPPKGTLLSLDLGDPVAAVDLQGIFYYARIAINNNNESIITVSTGQVDPVTNVLTLNNPLTIGVGEAPGGFQDKEWIAVGTDKNNPGTQALYVTWTDFKADSSDTIRFSKFSTGADPQQIIASKTIVPAATPGFSAVQGSFPVVDSQGNIYVFYEEVIPSFPEPSNKSIKMVKSIDGGMTFGSPVVVAFPVTAAANAFFADCGYSINIDATDTRVIRSNDFPHAAIAPDGTLFVVWNDGKNMATTGIDIYLAYSIDGGSTWTSIQVTNTTTFEFFPSVIFQSGKAHIQYSKFDDPFNVGGVGNGTFALFKRSFSIIDGSGPETMVSSVFSPVPITRPNNFDTVLAPGYMGDYNQIIAGPGNAIYHAWGDNHNILNGVPNPDVFFIQTNSEPIRGISFFD